jgi:hypothetical protein
LGLRNATQERVIELERRWGAHWQIWVVDRYIGGPLWCARPWSAGDNATQSISAGTVEELEELLKADDRDLPARRPSGELP